MSRKSKKTKGKSGGKALAWVVFAVLLAIVVALLLLIRGALENQNVPDDVETEDNAAENEISAPVTNVVSEAETVLLGDRIKIDGVLSYAGPFAEDRSDDFVMDVLSIRVTNDGDKYIQTMDIIIPVGDGEAVFSVSTLMPGDTVIVPEKNRMAYTAELELISAKAQNVAFFAEAPTLCEDKVKIDCLDGVINVTNVSGEDISGDIFIYYKTKVDGIYYGGVTYRVRIEGGLAEGEIRQGAAAHFNTENSTVVFVTCG